MESCMTCPTVSDVPQARPSAAVPAMLYDYAGAIHVHSTLSDGSGTVEEIIRAAQSATLDFLILTDHEHLDARDQGYEGWHDNLLLLVGEEVTPRFHNHYLAFGIREKVKGRGNRDPQEMVHAVAAQGGLGFIAHPIGEGYPTRAMACPWLDWQVTGFTGIEVWSYMHDWACGLSLANCPMALARPDGIISGPPRQALDIWDAIGKERPVVAIGTLDIHAARIPGLIYPRILPYSFVFRTIRTHVLLDEPLPRDEPAHVAAQVYRAIGAGRCFFAHDGFGDSTGFQFTAQRHGTVVATMGDAIPLQPDLRLYAVLPEPAHVCLLRDGAVIMESHGKRVAYSAAVPGVYRVEVRRDSRPWIFSNAIYVR
jgi:hypothetical protein